jgi:uncharacterized protein (TIGR02271 family)
MSQTTSRSTVVGVFRDRAKAEEAVDALHRAGFRDDQIGFAAHEGETPEGSEAIGHGTEAGEGATKGVVSGGIIGAVLGALATGLIPGIGPVIAGGLLAGIVGGAAVGAAAGGLMGALVGSMGVPEEEARYYDQEFRSGRTIVTVKADGRYDEAQRILRQYDAYDVESRDAATAPTASTTRDFATASTAGTDVQSRPREVSGDATRPAAGQQTLQLREEELQPRKQAVETGQVTLGKEVVEQERTLEVPTTREEVYVERHAVERRPSDRPVGEVADQTIEVPVREERVETEKQPVVYEEVGVTKQQVTSTQPVSDTVRREELRVQQEGDVRLSGAQAGTTTTTWEQAMPSYRQRWQQRYGTTGRWEESEPAYRYGWELRQRPEYRGRTWSDVESQVQRDWTTRHPATPWDRARESVREAWEQATD